MEIEVWSVGKAKFTADEEFQEPVIREVIDQRGDVASVILDYTDSERSDISSDEYARVTGDIPGLVLWEGRLTGDRNAPAPVEATADQLRALVWDMLQTMGPSREALGFAVRAGRLGVTDEQGRTLTMACAGNGTELPGDEARAALLKIASDAQACADTGLPLDCNWVVTEALRGRGELPAEDDDAAERADVLRMRREMAREAGDDSEMAAP